MIIVNSSKTYNLATAKLSAFYPTALVINYPSKPTPIDYHLNEDSKVLISAIFSWDLPHLKDVVEDSLFFDQCVEIGGPAVTHNEAALKWSNTSVAVRHQHEAEHVEGSFPMTWTSRGCIRNCPWCIVPTIEGRVMNEYESIQYAPLILDNNFLACSDSHIERVLKSWSGRKVDWNQGLDARLYTPSFRKLVAKYAVKPTAWRFAYDSGGISRHVQRAVEDVHKQIKDKSRIRIYLLFGYNESEEEAISRATEIIGWGGSPWPMAYRPLDWPDRDYYVAPGWSRSKLVDFRRFFSRPWLWASMNYEDYQPRKKADG
jgi:hypothetical protein|tara:strand:+ start:69 stop:1016 length:948 start_codon:yes stop_codon:yes gene_type:complete